MFEKHIKEALEANSTIDAACGGKISPLILAQGTPRPYIAWQITDRADPQPSHNGASGYLWITFDIAIVGDTYLSVAELSEASREALTDYAGTVDSTVCHWTDFQDETDIEQSVEDGREKPTYVRVQTFRSLYS